jgi:hypothetical protein
MKRSLKDTAENRRQSASGRRTQYAPPLNQTAGSSDSDTELAPKGPRLHTPDAKEAANPSESVQAMPAPSSPHVSPPELLPRENSYLLDGLTLDVWKVVLSFLSEYDRLQAKRVCQHFKLNVDRVMSDTLDPDSPQGNITRHRIYSRILPILREYSEARLRREDLKIPMAKFEEVVRDSASTIRCLDLDVWSGFEDMIIDVLMENPNAIWQNVRFYFDGNVDPTKFHRFWDYLKTPKQIVNVTEEIYRTVDVHVEHVKAGCKLAHFIPAPNNLRALKLGNLVDRQVRALGKTLSVNNNIQSLRIDIANCGESLFSFLETGTHQLRQLDIVLAGHFPLNELHIFWGALAQKTKLASLAISHGHIADGGYALGRILQAARELGTLELTRVKLGPSVKSNCEDWVEGINLHTIVLNQCSLIGAASSKQGKSKQASLDRKRDEHQYFLNIIARAPNLKNLAICLIGCGLANRALLDAFSKNAAARTVQLIHSTDGEKSQRQTQALIKEKNLLRKQKGMAEIRIEHHIMEYRTPNGEFPDVYRDTRRFGNVSKTIREWTDELLVEKAPLQALEQKLDKCRCLFNSANSPEIKRKAVEKYKTLLTAFAKRKGFLEFIVSRGFEQAARDALFEAKAWQVAKIHLSPSSHGSWISELEQDFLRSGSKRTRDLELNFYQPGSLQGALPEGTALRLIGLKVIDASPQALEPLRPLLEKPNPLACLSILGKTKADALLSWLEKGTHGLRFLRLDDDVENGAALAKLLHSKIYLTTLSLANGVFSAQGMQLATILNALPQLERLELTGMVIDADANTGCQAAFRNSGLYEIKIDNCVLSLPEAEGEAAFDPFQELLDGLREAPELTELEVVFEKQGEVEISPKRKRGTEALLTAYGDNPSAMILRIDPSRTDKVWARAKLREMNAARYFAGGVAGGFPPIGLVSGDSGE